MGRNRNVLGGGGQWGESMMETIMRNYAQKKPTNAIKRKQTSSTQQHWDAFYSQQGRGGGGGYAHENTAVGGGSVSMRGVRYRIIEKNEPLYVPRTPNQKLYLKYLSDERIKIVLGVGPAGCGKTLFACHRAIQELLEGGVEKIVITRPTVSVEDETVGFLPGDMAQKMAPWTRPIFDIFHEYFNPADVEDMVRKEIIEIAPLAYMRGRTFKKAFIIADEMQNSTPNQMLMITTRLGEGSKMAITGDLKQSDKELKNNGLSDLMRKLYLYRRNETASYGEAKKPLGIKLVQLCSADICRSEIVSRILDIYNVISTFPFESVQNTSVAVAHYYGPNNYQSEEDMGIEMEVFNAEKATENVIDISVAEEDTKTDTNIFLHAEIVVHSENHGSSDCAIIPKKDEDRLRK